MLKRMLPILVLVLTLGFAGATAAYAGDPVAIGDLPDPVTQAIEATFEGAELLNAEMDTDNGLVEYDVTFRYEGVLYEGKFLEDGTILDLEQK